MIREAVRFVVLFFIQLHCMGHRIGFKLEFETLFSPMEAVVVDYGMAQERQNIWLLQRG